MIIVVGSARIRSGRFDEALILSREHVARSRSEPGCIAHAVHRDDEDATRPVFIERWSDRASLQTHFDVPESRAFGRQPGALASERPTIELFDASMVPLPGGRGKAA